MKILVQYTITHERIYNSLFDFRLLQNTLASTLCSLSLSPSRINWINGYTYLPLSSSRSRSSAENRFLAYAYTHTHIHVHIRIGRLKRLIYLARYRFRAASVRIKSPTTTAEREARSRALMHPDEQRNTGFQVWYVRVSVFARVIPTHNRTRAGVPISTSPFNAKGQRERLSYRGEI